MPVPAAARHIERAHRILDAAAALVLRWGYDKTTIDDIAKQAGVAKGTIYLHWKTRQNLFLALIQRERLALAKDFRRRIASDPAGVTLRGITKHWALLTMQYPLLKALFLRDKDLLGKLSQTAVTTAAFTERVEGFGPYLEALRSLGWVRADLGPKAQLYLLGVVYAGFFLAAPFMPDEMALSEEEVADLMAETVHRTLETDRVPSPDELRSISQPYLDSVDRYIALMQEELQRQLAK